MDARRADLRALPKSDKIPLTNKKYFVFSLAAILSLALDQWSKVWARANLATGDRVIIPGYFDLTLAQNKGMAFSLLHNLPFGRYFLLIVAIVMLPVIFAIERKTDIRRVRMHVELGLIFGGALGKVVDRGLFGSVTDFIVWKVQNHQWPTFNIADAALVIGVIGLALEPQPRCASRHPGAGRAQL